MLVLPRRIRAACLALLVAACGIAAVPVTPADALDLHLTCELSPATASLLRTTLSLMSTTTCTTLELAPGAYDIGVDHTPLLLHPGTSTTPLTVRAADPSSPPLLVGGIYLAQPSWWTFEDLRFKTTTKNNIPGQPILGVLALALLGGDHFTVRNSEFYSGPGFQAATLLGIGASTTTDADDPASYPQAFTLSGNCFHDASRRIGNEDPTHDHLVYIATAYPTSIPAPLTSTVRNNIFYNSGNGAAMKVDQPEVTVAFNTFYNVSAAVTVQPTPESGTPPYEYSHTQPLHGIAISRNLVSRIIKTRGATGLLKPDRAFSVRDLDSNANPTGAQVSFINNQTWDQGHPYEYVSRFNTSLSQYVAADPVARSATQTQIDPRFGTVGGCGPTYFHATDRRLAGYGRYASAG